VSLLCGNDFLARSIVRGSRRCPPDEASGSTKVGLTCWARVGLSHRFGGLHTIRRRTGLLRCVLRGALGLECLAWKMPS